MNNQIANIFSSNDSTDRLFRVCDGRLLVSMILEDLLDSTGIYYYIMTDSNHFCNCEKLNSDQSACFAVRRKE